MVGKEAKLASSSVMRGFLDIRQDPPRLVSVLKTFRHPETNVQVSLCPLPNFGSPSFIRRVYSPAVLQAQFDKVLCEDGLLPIREPSALASRQRVLQRLFPFASIRLVAPESSASLYDGLVTRDRVETRMAYQMLRDAYDPPVDPRARRGVERLLTYADGCRVCVPWGVYHMHYWQYRLQREGFELVRTEEEVVIGFRAVLYMMFGVFVVSSWVLIQLLSYFIF